MHSSFFQGQTDRGQFYWPKHSRETRLSKREEEEEEQEQEEQEQEQEQEEQEEEEEEEDEEDLSKNSDCSPRSGLRRFSASISASFWRHFSASLLVSFSASFS
jgi:hypothetical protein